jgi:hypothetical protein
MNVCVRLFEYWVIQRRSLNCIGYAALCGWTLLMVEKDSEGYGRGIF